MLCLFITPLLQGQVTSDQQFSFVPRQPQSQPQPPNRFNPGPGFVSPSARPQVAGQDNVPTVPAVTNFQRFRPSEASDVETNLRFQPSPRPAFEQPGPASPGIFPPSNPPASFPVRPTLRTPTFTVPPSLSIEPISSQGVISRPSLVAQESETTGTAFRGRQRLRVRPDQVDTGTRTRPRNKVRFTGDQQEVQQEVEQEVETEAPPVPTAARGGRTRSRFSASRARAPTGSRPVPTGQRKRQRFQKKNNNDLPEEDRRSVAGSPRRKVNRVPSFTSRRKTTPPPEVPVTRIPPRRRQKPISFQDEEIQTESPLSQFDSSPSTKSSDALLRELLSSSKENSAPTDEGIAVLPASTVGELSHFVSRSFLTRNVKFNLLLSLSRLLSLNTNLIAQSQLLTITNQLTAWSP